MKKQSQFDGRKNDIIFVITKTYSFFGRLKTEKNKANQTRTFDGTEQAYVPSTSFKAEF